jgi:hypothetical protein
MCNLSLRDIILGPNCPLIHSLLFPDDLLICGHVDIKEANTMKAILQSFCSVSGQIANWQNLEIFLASILIGTADAIKKIFPVAPIDSSFIHIGHPLIIPSKNRFSAYDIVLDKFRNKFSIYKADHLSHATCLTLIQYVFASIPVYYMSNILFPKKFIAKLT